MRDDPCEDASGPDLDTSSVLQDRPLLVGLALIMVLHAGLVMIAVFERGALWHDEVISVLSATGHQDEWQRIEQRNEPPYGQWVPAEHFQRLFQTDRPLDLQGISRSTGDFDHHPPLFYWILHLGLLIGIPPLWAGPAVNLLVTAGTIYLLARWVLNATRHRPVALAASAAVMWSPAYVLAASHGLIYIVVGFALLALGLAVATSVGSTQPSSQNRATPIWSIWAAGTLAVLAHHQFVILAAVAALGLIATRRRRAAYALGAGVITGLAVFPYFWTHASRVVASATAFDASQIGARSIRWVGGLFDLLIPYGALEDTSHRVAKVLIVIVGLLLLGFGRRIMTWMRDEHDRGAIMFIAAAAVAIPAAAFALQRAPDHAIGGLYVAFLAPLLAAAITALPTAPAVLQRTLTVLSIVALASTCAWLWNGWDDGKATRGLLSEVTAADAVVTDCASRGYFGSIAVQLDPGTPVYLSTGEDLAAALAVDWRPPQGRLVFLHAPCPMGADVLAALAESGVDARLLGRLERYEVWAWGDP